MADTFPPSSGSDWQPLPADASLTVHWPTPNHALRSDPNAFFASTPANQDYGRPGWTRDCGKQFHRGCDIASVRFDATGATTTVIFTDCPTGAEYPSEEPVLKPNDDVFAVAEGVVVEAIDDPEATTFGRHVVLRHQWPDTGDEFFTVYAHLETVAVHEKETVCGGQRLGVMGQTSVSADARNWMAIAPHLHFEVWDGQSRAYDPAAFLERFLPSP